MLDFKQAPNLFLVIFGGKEGPLQKIPFPRKKIVIVYVPAFKLDISCYRLVVCVTVWL